MVALAPFRRWQALTAVNHGTWRGKLRAMLADAEWLSGQLEPFLRPEPSATRLVFVCLGNINRSAFAEQVARGLGAHCCSIGLSTTTGVPAFRTAVTLAREFDLDLSTHRATDISDYELQPRDLLLVMEVRHARRLVARGVPPRQIVLLGAWAAPRRVHLHDPHTLSDEYFRTCFSLIQSAVRGLVLHLRQAGSPCVAT